MYKYCIVPKCTNTSFKTPEKLFFNVPNDPKLRKEWYAVAKRDDKTSPSAQATRHCCEDHFDLEEDMENYIKFKLVGGRLKLKKGVFPHKFECQKLQKKKVDRPGFKKRQDIEYFERVLSKDIGHEDLLLHSIEEEEFDNQDSTIIQNSDPLNIPEELDGFSKTNEMGQKTKAVQGVADSSRSVAEASPVAREDSDDSDSDSDGLIDDPEDISDFLVFKDVASGSASTAEPSASTADVASSSVYRVDDNEGAGVEEIIIKEEISDEERKQCRLCLSVGRRLEELGEYAPLYRKLLFDSYQNTTIPSFMYEMLACWECRAELRRVQKFQDKVRRANAAFETSQNQTCKDLSSLSSVVIGEPQDKRTPDQSELVTRLEECAQTIKEEEVEMPEVEETALPDPLAVHPGVVKTSTEETVHIEYERQPTRSVKERAKSAQTQAKRASDVKGPPTKRPKPATSAQETSQSTSDTTQTSQTHDVTARADAPLDCDAIFGKVKIEFAELQCILSERRNKTNFKSMQYKCDSCVLGFTDQGRLHEHNSNFHDKNVGCCECDICERRFDEPTQLSSHYRNHFVKFVCQLCQFECYTKTGRVIHYKRHREAVRGGDPDSALRQRLAQATSSRNSSEADS